MDHFFQMEGFQTAHDPMLEGYTTLGYLAAKTERMKLGTVVTGVTYRHPGLLAKIATTLDVLSEGRSFFGIGAAWYEREHLALGVPYPAMSERFERLEEAIQIVLQMWSDDEGPFEGKHYQLAETINVPQPIQKPHPPIVIGGGGEKKTLRLVAKYADACNLNVTDVEEVAHKLQVLREHCDAEGRDYATIEKTMQGGPANPVADPDASCATRPCSRRSASSTSSCAPRPTTPPVTSRVLRADRRADGGDGAGSPDHAGAGDKVVRAATLRLDQHREHIGDRQHIGDDQPDDQPRREDAIARGGRDGVPDEEVGDLPWQ